MDRGTFASLSVEDLQAFLLDKGICSEIVSNFVTNRVSGSAFLKLTEEDLKDLVPIIGVRTDIRDILSQVSLIIFRFQSGSTIIK